MQRRIRQPLDNKYAAVRNEKQLRGGGGAEAALMQRVETPALQQLGGRRSASRRHEACVPPLGTHEQ